MQAQHECARLGARPTPQFRHSFRHLPHAGREIANRVGGAQSRHRSNSVTGEMVRTARDRDHGHNIAKVHSNGGLNGPPGRDALQTRKGSAGSFRRVCAKHAVPLLEPPGGQWAQLPVQPESGPESLSHPGPKGAGRRHSIAQMVDSYDLPKVDEDRAATGPGALWPGPDPLPQRENGSHWPPPPGPPPPPPQAQSGSLTTDHPASGGASGRGVFWRQIVPAGLDSAAFYTREFRDEFLAGGELAPPPAPASASLVFGTGLDGKTDSETPTRSRAAADQRAGATHGAAATQDEPALHPTRISFLLAEAPGAPGGFFVPSRGDGGGQAVWFESDDAHDVEISALENAGILRENGAGGHPGGGAPEEAGVVERLCRGSGGTGRALRVCLTVNLPVRVMAGPPRPTTLATSDLLHGGPVIGGATERRQAGPSPSHDAAAAAADVTAGRLLALGQGGAGPGEPGPRGCAAGGGTEAAAAATAAAAAAFGCAPRGQEVLDSLVMPVCEREAGGGGGARATEPRLARLRGDSDDL
jgi:hypothetical protein